MKIAAMTFRLHAPWVHSLKEKRMIVKSLVTKLQNKFHVSAAEIDEQDTHQLIVIGVASIVPHNAMADSLMDDISLFVEEKTPPDILWHGTGEKYVASIDAQGLIPKSRLYVHLSSDKETAKKVGSRHGRPVIYEIDCRQMAADGYRFFESAKHVWLTKEVPVRYLRKL